MWPLSTKISIALGITFLCIAIGVPLAAYGCRKKPPQTLAEAAERMKEDGLHVIVMAYGEDGSLTGSTQPIRQEEALGLTIGGDWAGKVRAYPAKFVVGIPTVEGVKAVRWGGLILAGDPEIVDRLTFSEVPRHGPLVQEM